MLRTPVPVRLDAVGMRPESVWESSGRNAGSGRVDIIGMPRQAKGIAGDAGTGRRTRVSGGRAVAGACV